MKISMKILSSTVAALAIVAASASSAYARDSFSLGINVGGYGYAPPPTVYYSQPIYYSEPVYYRPAPRAYYAAPAVISFGYQNYGGHRGYNSGYNRGHHGGWGHENRGNNGWGRGNEGRGGHGRDHGDRH